MQPFSVLLSVYYKESPLFLDASLNSIYNQTLPPTEVVLVEDGALTVDLEEIVAKYEKNHDNFRVLRLPENRGLGNALRSGLEMCTYDLVARMDSDDICRPERFQKQITAFGEHPEIDVCGAWVDEFKTLPKDTVSTRRLPETHDELYAFGKKRNPVNHPVVMFRRKSVLNCGSYMDFPLFEDYYLWARMMMQGCRFYCIQESLLDFRKADGMIRRRGGMNYAMTEMRLQWTFHKIGYISLLTMFKNMTIRFIARIIPDNLRNIVYDMIRKR